MADNLLYKYRGVEPWEYLLDILINRRLYASSYQKLNDPMEGIFTYSQDKASPSFIEQMMDKKSQLRICSLSKAYNSTVMWSYYAAAHQGVVIGVAIDKTAPNVIDVTDVTYSEDNVFKGFLGSDAETEARKILAKKLTAWTHEQEVRVFSRADYVPITIREIYFGCQMVEDKKKLLGNLIRQIDPAIKLIPLERSNLDSRVPENVI